MGRKIRVLHISKSTEFYGVEHDIADTIENTKDQIRSMYLTHEGPVEKELSRKKISFKAISGVNLSTTEIQNVIKAFRPDVIHAHGFECSIKAALAGEGVPIISHLHNSPEWSEKVTLKSVLYLICQKDFAAVLADSEDIRDRICFKRFIEKKISVIGVPFDANEIRRGAEKSAYAEKFDIVFCGRLNEQKCSLQLIYVIERIREKKPDIKVVFVGDGPLRKKMKELISEKNLEDNVSFAGYLMNPYGVIRESRVVGIVQPDNGVSRTSLEAGALDKPVVFWKPDREEKTTVDDNPNICSSPDTMADCLLEALTQNDVSGKTPVNEKYFTKKSNKEVYYTGLKKQYEKAAGEMKDSNESTIYFYGNDYRSFSFGIVCQYEFVRVLNEKGICSRFICFEPRDTNFDVPKKYQQFIQYCKDDEVDLSDTDVVVYPELVPGNPLKAKRVIRWLLNRPYVLTGTGIHYGESDLLYSYSNYVNPVLPQLFYLPDDRKLFARLRKNGKYDKKTISIYFGKTYLDKLNSRKEEIKDLLSSYSKVNVITRMVPARREDALKLIADSDLLLSFDPFSNMNFEANILGVPVLILDDSYGIRDREFNIKLRGFAFSVDEIEEKRKAVPQVYIDYCTWLSGQEQYIADTVCDAVKKFEAMEKSKSLLQANAGKNRATEKEDLRYYNEVWKNRKPFSVILSPQEIPLSVARIIGLKNINPDGGISSVYRARVKFVLKDALRMLLRKAGLLEAARSLRRQLRR